MGSSRIVFRHRRHAGARHPGQSNTFTPPWRCRHFSSRGKVHPTVRQKADLGTVFDDRATRAMGEAFDAACKELHDRGQSSIVYGVIAARIIEAARSGERDPERLKEEALAAFSGKQH
jgi:hypothetical protein